MTTDHKLDVRYIAVGFIMLVVLLSSLVFFEVTLLDILYFSFVIYAVVKYMRLRSTE